MANSSSSSLNNMEMSTVDQFYDSIFPPPAPSSPIIDNVDPMMSPFEASAIVHWAEDVELIANHLNARRTNSWNLDDEASEFGGGAFANQESTDNETYSSDNKSSTPNTEDRLNIKNSSSVNMEPHYLNENCSSDNENSSQKHVSYMNRNIPGESTSLQRMSCQKGSESNVMKLLDGVFEFFSRLPDELQLMIIREAYMVPRIIMVMLPGVSPWPRSVSMGSPFAAPPALLQVNKMFREEGEKLLPLTLGMSTSDAVYKPRLRMNFELDTLVLPEWYLDSLYRGLKDANKIQHIVISHNNDSPRTQAFAGEALWSMKSLVGPVKVVNQRTLMERSRANGGRNLYSGYWDSDDARFNVDIAGSQYAKDVTDRIQDAMHDWNGQYLDGMREEEDLLAIVPARFEEIL